MNRRFSQVDQRMQQFESRVLAEERAKEYVSQSKMDSMSDRLAQLEKSVKVVNAAQVKHSPVKAEQGVRALEADLRVEREKSEKRLRELLQRMSIVEEALKSEQETSIQALQALLAD